MVGSQQSEQRGWGGAEAGGTGKGAQLRQSISEQLQLGAGAGTGTWRMENVRYKGRGSRNAHGVDWARTPNEHGAREQAVARAIGHA